MIVWDEGIIVTDNIFRFRFRFSSPLYIKQCFVRDFEIRIYNYSHRQSCMIAYDGIEYSLQCDSHTTPKSIIQEEFGVETEFDNWFRFV